MKHVFLLVLAMSVGCTADQLQETPFVQHSASSSPRWTIDLNRVLDGVFRTYRPRCIDTVRQGHTVEFRNFMPDVPGNVSTLSGPDTLYSPNLQAPYNYVSRTAEENKLCEVNGSDGTCEQRPHYSYWRHVFDKPGVYDWIDTHSGAPGRKVVDPYYGTVTFIGIDPDATFGTICVLNEDGSGCDSICCTDDDDCGAGKRCFRLEVDAVGRCLTPSG